MAAPFGNLHIPPPSCLACYFQQSGIFLHPARDWRILGYAVAQKLIIDTSCHPEIQHQQIPPTPATPRHTEQKCTILMGCHYFLLVHVLNVFIYLVKMILSAYQPWNIGWRAYLQCTACAAICMFSQTYLTYMGNTDCRCRCRNPGSHHYDSKQLTRSFHVPFDHCMHER